MSLRRWTPPVGPDNIRVLLNIKKPVPIIRSGLSAAKAVFQLMYTM